MALKQVGARTEGDIYQGLFFWREAAALLIANSGVKEVHLEHDAASGVDDVAVFYNAPGMNAGGWLVSADFYQLKYHVDRRTAYSADALADPSFSNTKHSLLQRFHNAYSRVVRDHKHFRLHLASNWRWRDDDPLANVLQEYDGKLPEKFFTAGDASQLGKVRESWRSHLALHKDDFEAFGRTLRLQLDHFGRRLFREMVHDRLAAVGLRVPSGDQVASIYESLIQQFVMNGTNSFNASSLRQLCDREGLLASSSERPATLPTIGVRSFIRFAERLENETDDFICVAENFEGRHPRLASSWSTSAQQLVEFFGNVDRRSRLREREHAIALECHGSFATLSGYELSRSSGCAAFPMQKPERSLWKPVHVVAGTSQSDWTLSRVERDVSSEDIAVTLSVTHNIDTDVERYLDKNSDTRLRALICLRPTSELDPLSWTPKERQIWCRRWTTGSGRIVHVGALPTSSEQVRFGSCSKRARAWRRQRGSWT